MKHPKSIILVNLDANNKNAGKKWISIEDEVLERMPHHTKVTEYRIPFNIKRCLEHEIIQNNVKCIISAGGDGSGNIILNELMKLSKHQRNAIQLGFIGMGSSNDILKPYDKMIGDIPIKIDLNRSIKSDVGHAKYINEKGEWKEKYFLANSSIGVGASANLLFNRGDAIIRFLKAKWTNMAINYTIFKSILAFKNYPVEIELEGKTRDVLVSHLSILKNPHISGDLKFDQKISQDDGKLGLNICENMSMMELIRVMKDLKNGVFSGKPKRFSSYINEMRITPEKTIPVEFDGEIELVMEVQYRIVSRSINILK